VSSVYTETSSEGSSSSTEEKRLETLQNRLQARRSNLQAARHSIKADEAPTDDPFFRPEGKLTNKMELWASAIASVNFEWAKLADDIAEARQALVHELLSIYHIQPIEDVEEGSPVEATLCRISGSFLPPISDIKRESFVCGSKME
jgi:hypothetical protein